ncbi:YMGG-like glycine zipper-containing protein [Methylomarinum sp. Ch1-1]|uniref:YMGG-like glycine zipper-containing protein n=1 Tax=Methylomarinum roseum TaxID=3067653 RepID=A0AAU7NTD9_9GAMM|nr:YMGG-like glycine zipper-containing protein [Methylomarinum sp. Ch1-1]MDP4519692.1 glycine zipper family protein [Methylomarinum sp. Ch1-1]
MINVKTVLASSVLISLSGCAYMPTAPSVMVLPGTAMSFEQFRQDDYFCRQYAYAQVGGVSANQAAVDSQVGSAIAGTALGAAAGAALGGGRGAAIGAGSGLVAGSMVGSGEGRRAAYATQRDYDNAYIQCMYAQGHRVPVSGHFYYENQIPEESSRQIPPPPPGSPPPPPYR